MWQDSPWPKQNWVDISGSFKFWYFLYVCCIIACDSAPGCLVACAVALSFCIFYICAVFSHVTQLPDALLIVPSQSFRRHTPYESRMWLEPVKARARDVPPTTAPQCPVARHVFQKGPCLLAGPTQQKKEGLASATWNSDHHPGHPEE